MSSSLRPALLLVIAIVVMNVSSMSIGQRDQMEQVGPDFTLIDDDGSLDTALINYLFARQMYKRLQGSGDITDLRQKRSYWKQCAFNAVSCFGRK